MLRPLYLHFGPHKTGTTSIQHYLKQRRLLLAAQGVTVFRNIKLEGDRILGHKDGTNCFQIANLMLRPELETIVRRQGRAKRPDQQVVDRLLDEINALLHACPTEAVVVSSETFSFLRTDQERASLERLAAGFALRPIGFFRDKAAWMNSWRRQVEDNMAARVRTTDVANTIFDFSMESWLLDYEAIHRFFGPDGQYLSYDQALEAHGTVVPAFLESLGLDPAKLPGTDRVWLNTTTAA